MLMATEIHPSKVKKLKPFLSIESEVHNLSSLMHFSLTASSKKG